MSRIALRCSLCLLVVVSVVLGGCSTPGPSAQPNLVRVGPGIGPAALAYTPDGALLVDFRPFYNELVVQDAKTLEARHRIKGRDAPTAGAFSTISFTPDGRTVAVAGLDDQLTVWNVAQWTELRRFPETRGVTGAVMFPDGRMAATAGPDNFARLWDVESGVEVGRLAGHAGALTSIALSPDAKTLATGSMDRTVRLWNVESRELIATLEGHVAPIMSLSFSPDGKALASTAACFDVRLWQAREVDRAATPLIDPGSEAAARRSGDIAAQAAILVFSFPVFPLNVLLMHGVDYLNPAFVCPIAYSPDGRMLAMIHHLEDLSSAKAYKIEVYDPAAQRRLSTYAGAFFGGISGALAFSPDGTTLAMGGISKVILLDPRTGEERQR
jgi:hypothetical protein